jgi:hypothetical protein
VNFTVSTNDPLVALLDCVLVSLLAPSVIGEPPKELRRKDEPNSRADTHKKK